MNCLLKNKMNINFNIQQKRRPSYLPFKIIFGIAISLIIIHIIAPSALSSFFIPIVRPFWNIENTVRYGNAFISISDLVKENQELNMTLIKNQMIYVQANSMKKENDELKEMFGRSISSRPILAQILKKPPFSAYDTFILDVGRDVGIEKGNMVYALGNIPIGEIALVTDNTSKVLLYSSSGGKFDVLIGDSNIEATAIGKSGGTFEITLPRDTKIVKGDNIKIPSLSDSFLGTVEEIISESSHPFSTILFRQPINIYELRWVIVDMAKISKRLEITAEIKDN
ncbi:MAG TPA: rod shape-determining protein MreC [Candidatus Paceibacterota bacterium]